VTDTLVTAIGNVTTRLLLMEPLAVSAATYATKRWVEFVQNPPYWCNRVGGASAPTGPESLPTFEVTFIMRLILDFKENITRLDDVDGNAQENAWGYIASTLRYFERYRMLDTSTLAALAWVAPQGTRISCPVGLDLKIAPLTPTVYLAVDFNLVVPLLVGAEET